jgi:hypothetical protein
MLLTRIRTGLAGLSVAGALLSPDSAENTTDSA